MGNTNGQNKMGGKIHLTPEEARKNQEQFNRFRYMMVGLGYKEDEIKAVAGFLVASLGIVSFAVFEGYTDEAMRDTIKEQAETIIPIWIKRQINLSEIHQEHPEVNSLGVSEPLTAILESGDRIKARWHEKGNYWKREKDCDPYGQNFESDDAWRAAGYAPLMESYPEPVIGWLDEE